MGSPIPMGIYVTFSDGSIARLKSRCCSVCGRQLHQSAVDTGLVIINRIGGDSANGYEGAHWSCVLPEPLTPTAADRDDDDA